ncbi:MAG: hypothetical protein ACR2RF_11845 [Geminicoccaceae bacterium]
MQRLIWLIPFVMLSSSVHATLISFNPALGFLELLDDTPPPPIENFTIVTQRVSTSTTGSGRARAELYSWDVGRIEVALGTGPGSASASLLSIATFDLAFASPGLTFVKPFIGINGPFSSDPGDISIASWDIFVDIDGVPPFGDSQTFACANPIESERSCGNFFDSNTGLLRIFPGKNLRVPVRTIMRFDLSAVRVHEPGSWLIIFCAAGWLIRRSVKTSKVAAS